MHDLVAFMNLFPMFRAASWDRWRAVLAGVVPEVRELWAVLGRGCGKTLVASLIVVAFAVRDWPRTLGERIFCAIVSPDRKQSGVAMAYIRGMLRAVPALAALVVSESRETIELSNGVTIEIITASTAAPRGRSYAVVVLEEASFFNSSDAAANPDVELLRAVRPALARVPGSLLVVISSRGAGPGWSGRRSRDISASPPRTSCS
jgi:phage terminase large subunit-like protein